MKLLSDVYRDRLEACVMKLLITGATGYIGARLRNAAKVRGHEVISLCRSIGTLTPQQWLHYDIRGTDPIVIPLDADAVVHLASSERIASESDFAAETASASALLRAARLSDAKFIFVSSQTASKDAPTMYGRSKWAIEQEVLKAGGWVVRPGQVYGGDEKGLFGILIAAVRSLPVLPAFVPAPHVQPIHIDDVATALLTVAERNDLAPRVVCVADPHPITFTRFLSLIASQRLRVRRLFLPVPKWLVRAAALLVGNRIAAKLGLGRLASLFALPAMNTADDLHLLDLQLRPLYSGMRRATVAKNCYHRRLLIREAKIFLSYILYRQPGLSLQVRYVRAVETLRDGVALNLPTLIVHIPTALAMLDDRDFTASPAGKEFLWRLNAATLLSEATTFGASRFLGIGEASGIVRYGSLIARAVAMEIVWRLCSFIFLPSFVRRFNSEATK